MAVFGAPSRLEALEIQKIAYLEVKFALFPGFMSHRGESCSSFGMPCH